MKVLGNSTNKNIVYKDKRIGKAANLLLSNDGTIIDEIVDNSAELEKTKNLLEEKIDFLEKENADLKEELEKQKADFESTVKDMEEVIANSGAKFEYDETTKSLNIIK